MAKKIQFEIEVDDSGAVKSLGQVEDGVEGIGKAAESSESGVDKLTKGFNALKSATVFIGLLTAAFALLQKAFTSSEEGQNKFNKAIAIFESIVGNLTDLIAVLADQLVGLFEDPLGSLKAFGDFLVQNIINRFVGLFELIPKLAKSVSLLFEGEFTKAGRVATDAIGKVVLGVEDITEKTIEAAEATAEFVKELEREAEVAADIADQRARIDKIERELLVERAEANARIAEITAQTAARDQVSAEERIRLLQEAAAIEDEITQKEIKAAELRLDAAVRQAELSNSNKDDLNEIAQLEADLINLRTASANQQKALTAEIVGARQEIKAQAEADKKAEEDAAAQAEKEAQEQIELEQQRAIDRQAFELELMDEGLEKELALLQAQKEKELALADELGVDRAKIEKKFLDLRIKAVTAANAAEIQAQKQKEANAIALAQNTLNVVAGAFEQGSKEAKAVAVAQTIIETYKSATAAFSSLAGIPVVGPALGAAAAAAAVVAGFKNVQKIIQTKPEETTSPGGRPAVPNVPSITNETNTANVGPPTITGPADTGINQLGNTITTALDRPARAYVVQSDITEGAQLERQTQANATV